MNKEDKIEFIVTPKGLTVRKKPTLGKGRVFKPKKDLRKTLKWVE